MLTYDRHLLTQSLRFATTGCLNTALGFSVLAALIYAGVNEFVANFIGYAAGLAASFALNRNWTFERSGRLRPVEIYGFAAVWIIAYLGNLAVVFTGKALGFHGSIFVHLVAVGCYSLIFFFLNRQFVFAEEELSVRSAVSRKAMPEAVAVIGSLLALPFLLSLKLTHDVSWQFWIARQMINGVPLYERIMEVNPPLWFWLAMPLAALGDAVGVTPDRFYIIFISALSLFSAIITGRFLEPEDSGRRLFVIGALLILYWLAPLYDFGQREQITAIAALPYCALVFKRQQNESVGIYLAITIGVIGALGFAMKHYFVLVPVALELWLYWHSRNLKNVVRPETVALGLCALGYGLSVVLVTPHFFTHLLPVVNAAYGGYERSLLIQVTRIEVAVWLLSFAAIVSARKSLRERERYAADMLYITGACFIAAYFLQQKGWQYHAIPASVCLALACLYLLAMSGSVNIGATARRTAYVAAVLLVVTGAARGPYQPGRASEMSKLLSGAKTGDSVMILTSDPRMIFPAVEDSGLRWPSRYFSFWMIASIAKAQASGTPMSPELARLADTIRQEAIEDIRCSSPQVIVSHIYNRTYYIAPDRFRMTDFFRQNGDFSRYLQANYRLNSSTAEFEIYERTTKPDRPGAACTKIY